jgi:DedD protein
MADRITEDADLAVDELRRRARRRLVGAIVLALAAAVILPLLLEKEPKPLGDDVSVQIPPVDEGKFVNRLTGKSGDAKSAAKSDTRPLPKVPPKIEAPAPSSVTTDATPPADTSATPAPAPPTPAPVAPTPRKSVSEAEQKVLAGAARTPPPPPKSEPAPAPAAPAKPTAAAPSPPPVVSASAAPAPASSSAATSPSAAAGEGFAVQIAAFTDDKGANALVGKLKKAGFASSYTEPVETSRGTLWRVRVGGFASRPDADAARAKLKADGWNGIVVAVK